MADILRKSGSSRRDYMARVDGATRQMQTQQCTVQTEAMHDAISAALRSERHARSSALDALASALAKEIADRKAGDLSPRSISEVSGLSAALSGLSEAYRSADAALDARLAALEASRVRKFCQSIGNGVLASFTLTHNFNTTDVIVQVFTPTGIIVPLSVSRAANAVTITFALALAANSRVVILG